MIKNKMTIFLFFYSFRKIMVINYNNNFILYLKQKFKKYLHESNTEKWYLAIIISSEIL